MKTFSVEAEEVETAKTPVAHVSRKLFKLFQLAVMTYGYLQGQPEIDANHGTLSHVHVYR